MRRTKANQGDSGERILSPGELRRKVGLSTATIWRMENRGEFPMRLKVSPGRVGWLLSEVDRWILERPRRIVFSRKQGKGQ